MQHEVRSAARGRPPAAPGPHRRSARRPRPRRRSRRSRADVLDLPLDGVRRRVGAVTPPAAVVVDHGRTARPAASPAARPGHGRAADRRTSRRPPRRVARRRDGPTRCGSRPPRSRSRSRWLLPVAFRTRPYSTTRLVLDRQVLQFCPWPPETAHRPSVALTSATNPLGALGAQAPGHPAGRPDSVPGQGLRRHDHGRGRRARRRLQADRVRALRRQAAVVHGHRHRRDRRRRDPHPRHGRRAGPTATTSTATCGGSPASTSST